MTQPYRQSTQPNGLITIHDVSIFAQCKRGKIDYDEAWLDRAVAIAKAEEAMDFRPSVFVKHNDDSGSSRFDPEDAVGLMANFRRQKVRAHGELREGIVVDLVNLDPDVAQRIQEQRLCGRSIEAFSPKLRQKIDGVALLGRTPPYHSLAQSSEPADEDLELAAFSLTNPRVQDPENPEYGQRVMMEMNMDGSPTQSPTHTPSQPQRSPQQPAQPHGNIGQAITAAVMQVLAQFNMGGAPQPAAQAPAAAPAAANPQPAAPTPPARMSVVEQERFELAEATIQQLTAERDALQAALQATGKLALETENENALFQLLQDMKDEGRVYSEDYVRKMVGNHGIEKFRSDFLPLIPTAPVGSPPSATSAANTATGTAFQFQNDDDLKQFSAASPEIRRIAANAAAEFDATVRKSPGFANEFNTRENFIRSSVRRAQES